MKGIVFTELLNMVEDKFGYETMSKVIRNADLPHKGIYISGGTYPHEELVSLVLSLHRISGAPVPDLLRNYGRYLFKILANSYPQFAQAAKNPIEFINSVEDYIHVEVRKLYPGAELPAFEVIEKTDDTIVLHYKSGRKMEDFGHGMMLGCADYYKMPLHIHHEIIPNQEQHTVRFKIQLMTQEEAAKANEQEKQASSTLSGNWLSFIKKLFGTK